VPSPPTTAKSRGHRLELSVDPLTGLTSIVSDAPVPVVPGTTAEISLRQFDGSERRPAELSVTVAGCGKQYSGPSQPSWYNADDLRELFIRATPDTATVGRVVKDIFDLDINDRRMASKLTPEAVAELHAALCQMTAGHRFEGIGYIGNHAAEHYGRIEGVTKIGAALIPFCVEAWAKCEHAGKADDTEGEVELMLNRSPSLAPFYYSADTSGLWVRGCGLRGSPGKGAKRARYGIVVSVITPFIRLMNDGKTVYLNDFRAAVFSAIHKAAAAAYRAMIRPPSKISIAGAARQVMEAAYMKASDDGTLPANARQIMYAARPTILRLAGVEKFSDNRFTQYHLPDFITANPQLCADWDVVFDARGHYKEPHTGREFGIGTLEVRRYVGHRPAIGPAVTLNINSMFPTSGPKHRYRNILFIEKEGFGPLLEQARIAERYDLAIMSCKGLSVTASRLLLDRLAPQIDRVLVLHDFDITGFSIFGTLGTDGRRYVYQNKIEFIDIGLRLTDVRAMDLQSEPVEVEGDHDSRAKTLREHGATKAEVDFLLGYDGEGTKRTELNSMTSRQFVDFLERKLAEHGVEKVVPDAEIIEQHARRLVEQRLAKEEIEKIRDRLAKEAAAHKLPRGLAGRVRKLLTDRPELSWDMALALILQT
jgi:hypothetical protein